MPKRNFRRGGGAIYEWYEAYAQRNNNQEIQAKNARKYEAKMQRKKNAKNVKSLFRASSQVDCYYEKICVDDIKKEKAAP